MPIDTVDYIAFAAPLELAAAQAYQAAIDGGTLDATWTAQAYEFQGQHQIAVTSLTALIPASVPADERPNPVPDQAFVAGPVATVAAAADQAGALTALSAMEETLAATHLAGLGEIDEPTFAKAVAQVLATTSQRAVALGQATGTDPAALTPATASTDGAVEPAN